MRVLAIVLSNGAASLVSLMLTIIIARQDGPTQLGIFGISYAVLSLTQLFAKEVGLNRALSSPGDLVQMQTAYSRTLLIAVAVTIPALIVGLMTTNLIVITTSVAIPGYITFTFLRLLTMTEGQMKRGFVADLVMLTVVVAACVCVIIYDTTSVFVLVAWALILPLCSLILQSHLALAPRLRWHSSSKHYSGITFGIQSLFGAGSVHLSTFLLAGLFNALLVGAIRAASTLFGPVNLLTTSINTLTIRQLASAGQANRRATMVKGFILSTCIGVLGTAITLILIYYFGELALGESWEVVAPLVPWVALDAAFVATGVAPRGAHRVDMRGQAAWKVSIFMGISRLILLPTGGWLAGATGVAVFLAVSSLLTSGLWWVSYFTYRRRPD